MRNIVVRISDGIGNQLFMYANALSLSRKTNSNLLIDNSSGYFKKKNQIRKYELDKFNIKSNLCKDSYKFNSYLLDQKRKFLKKIDFIKKEKLFYIEPTDITKKTYFVEPKINFSHKLHLEGYFQTEKYFIKHILDLRKEFTIKKEYLEPNNNYIKLLQKTNSVSISIRQNRFLEGRKVDFRKSKDFTLKTINYINKAVVFFKNKINDPVFYIWSDDFTNLENYLNKDNFFFISHKKNKSLNDFNLFKYSKHFIVGPTTFHWWGAWLNENPDKICVRPKDMNPSNNKDFWPENWIPI